jgi:hypothetical protein
MIETENVFENKASDISVDNSSDDERMIDTGLSSGGAKSETEASSPSCVSLVELASASYIEDGDDDVYVPVIEERGPTSKNGLSRKPTVVRFQRRVGNGDDLSMSTSTDSVFMLDTSGNQDAYEMRMKLKEVECELSAEKAIRRKKDASLVKLAKQLQKSSRDSDAKEQQVLKMAKTINELESILQHQRRESADDQQKIRRICRETEDRLQEYEELVLSLKRQLAETKLEAEMLSARIEMQQEIASMGSLVGDGESVAHQNRDIEIVNMKDVQSTSWMTNERKIALALSGVAIVCAGVRMRGVGRLR